MRLIDADLVVSKLQAVLDGKANKKESTAYFAFRAFIDLIDTEPTIDPATLAPKWVSVKERLPTTKEMVLVLFENGDIMNATYEGNIDDVSQFGTYRRYYDFDTLDFLDSKWISYEGITHWMPLPEPPKPKRNTSAELRRLLRSWGYESRYFRYE